MSKVLDAKGREANPTCNGCDNKPHVLGLVFISGLRCAGTKWVDRAVVDLRPVPVPVQSGKHYCELELRDGKLHLFGAFAKLLSFGPLSRTIVWVREPEAAPPAR